VTVTVDGVVLKPILVSDSIEFFKRFLKKMSRNHGESEFIREDLKGRKLKKTGGYHLTALFAAQVLASKIIAGVLSARDPATEVLRRKA
jgi:hypothetical protein